METEPIEAEIVQETEERPKIYSRRAISGFAVFFTTIFGAVLLMQNLNSIGKRKEAYIILICSIFYTIFSIIVVNIPDKPHTSLTMLLNIAGAVALSEFLFKKYFPDEKQYPKKKIWKPLIISIAIILPFLLALIFC